MIAWKRQRKYIIPMGAIGIAGLVHAVVYWPVFRVLALFGGGILIVFTAEFAAVEGGLLDHRLQPQLLGVPIVIIIGWPGLIYFALRLAQLVVGPGALAAVVAGVLATAGDIFFDPIGVRDGAWQYRATVFTRRRYLDVPFWNFLAWFLISSLTALLPTVI